MHLIMEVFVGLFSASVVIFLFIFFFVESLISRPNAPIFDRQRGFSNRTTAAMFMATVINFLLFGLDTGTQAALFIVFI